MLRKELDQSMNYFLSTGWEPCFEPLIIEPRSQLHPSSEKPLNLELKALSEYFKCACLVM